MYYKLLRMGQTRALYAVPPYFKYYLEKEGNLLVGRGSLGKIKKLLSFNSYKYEESDETTKARLPSTVLVGDIPEREYQVGDIGTIKGNKTGIIRLGTGYGKTIIACKLIKAIERSTLILVPRIHLVDQFIKEFRRWYNYEPGIIQGNNWTIRDITIASIQTLGRRKRQPNWFYNTFGCVIVDECHTAITNKRLQLIQSFNPEHLYGMTATPRRTDEQGKAIEFTFGPIIIDKDLETTKPIVKLIYSHVHIPIVFSYAEMIDKQVENEIRNDLLIKIIHEEIKEGRKILVLTKRIAHYGRLISRLREYSPIVISSAISSKERNEIISGLRDGRKEFQIILGTYSMLATGTDIPALDTLIFAGDLKSDVLQEQSAGRILRIFSGKKHPKIIDIVDNGNGILLHQAKARIKWYKKQEWKIEL